MNPNVDYYELLAKYIRHIKFSGDSTLLDSDSILDSIVQFSDDEIDTLMDLDFDKDD